MTEMASIVSECLELVKRVPPDRLSGGGWLVLVDLVDQDQLEDLSAGDAEVVTLLSIADLGDYQNVLVTVLTNEPRPKLVSLTNRKDVYGFVSPSGKEYQEDPAEIVRLGSLALAALRNLAGD